MGLPASPALSPRENQIFAALPADEYERLQRHLTFARIELGASLYESGSRIRYVYFPIEGIVSLLYVTRAGKSTELALIGREGMVGASIFMGGETAPNRAVVQSVCRLYRLPAALLKERFADGGTLQLLLLKFTQTLITQISQTAVCNLHHSVEQQLSRWLLPSLDRLMSNRLLMTQELIANMLGVRRQGVAEAAQRLEREGLIEYRRGLVTVLDRARLEARACECYAVVKKESAHLLPQTNFASP